MRREVTRRDGTRMDWTKKGDTKGEKHNRKAKRET